MATHYVQLIKAKLLSQKSALGLIHAYMCKLCHESVPLSPSRAADACQAEEDNVAVQDKVPVL